MAHQGTIYLIPTPLGNVDPNPTLAPHVAEALESIELFVAEKPKTAARFLARMGLGERLERIVFVSTDRLSDPQTIGELLGELAAGHDIGVLAEAGCPGVADPGAEIVRAAHSREIPIVPLVGPSSVVLALMASGLNGQSFSFHGYLPADRSRRIESIRRLERNALSSGATQIVIEAPHRNDHLLTDLAATCRSETLICVALDLTLPSEYIRTMAAGAWRKNKVILGKRPAIFLLGAPGSQQRRPNHARGG